MKEFTMKGSMKALNKRNGLAAISIIMLISLSACSSNAGNGALIGALAGAAIGKSTVNHHDNRAAIGAVVGGAAGAVVGSQRDLQQPRYRQNPSYPSDQRYQPLRAYQPQYHSQ